MTLKILAAALSVAFATGAWAQSMGGTSTDSSSSAPSAAGSASSSPSSTSGDSSASVIPSQCSGMTGAERESCIKQYETSSGGATAPSSTNYGGASPSQESSAPSGGSSSGTSGGTHGTDAASGAQSK
jgi:hypothetical protein